MSEKRYWWHAESDSLVTTETEEEAAEVAPMCDELTREQFIEHENRIAGL